MRKLSFLIIFSSQILMAEPPLPLKALYLKVMQEPTGKNFQIFQKACKAGNERLHFTNDEALLATLKPKKRFIGPQVHVLALTLQDCLEPDSLSPIQNTFSTEVIPKNLKRLISISCRENFSDELILKMVNKDVLPLEKVKKRIKTITVQPKCSNFKASFERAILP